MLSIGSTTLEDPSTEVGVRIVARRLADGGVEFGLQQRGGDGSWGGRQLPARRFFPPDAGVGRWLASSPFGVAAIAPAPDSPETPREPTPAGTPQASPLERGDELVASSGYHTCAINAGEGVECWGDNRPRFRLGNASVEQAASPISVPGISDAVAISIGDSSSGTGDGHTCILHSDRTVSCWGSDQGGAMGQGTPRDLGPPADDRPDRDPSVPVVGPAVGLAVPTRVPGIVDAVAVSAGGRNTCVVHADGGASCWGENGSGNLGDGTGQSRDWPERVRGLSGVVAIAAGWTHACALHSDGTVSCWGSNNFGQLGDGTSSDSRLPVKVRGIDDAVAVSASSLYTCAVHRSGQLSCWGRNVSNHNAEFGNLIVLTGMLGTGSLANRVFSPAPVIGITDAVAVGTGRWSSCAVHKDGGVSCWGTNAAGQLGIGTMEHRWEPQRLANITDAVAVTVSSREQWGGSHACVVSAGSGVLCWGDNRYGQLGVGDTEPRLSPTSTRATDDAGQGGNAATGVIPALTLPDWSDEASMVDAGPFRAAMDQLVEESESAFPWLRIAWDHIRDDVRLFDEAAGATTLVSCGFSRPREYDCLTSELAIGTRLNRLSMSELLRIGVHELAHVYDQATALTPARAWGAVQLYFAVTYPNCHQGGEEILADTMLHLVDPDAHLTYYGPQSSCPDAPVTPTEEAKNILRTGLAGEVPAWYTQHVTDGAALWRLFRDAPTNLALLSNLMNEFGGLCRTDFLRDWRLVPPRDSNPFRDGGC